MTTRGSNRKKYTSPYIVVMPIAPFALVDAKDGFLKAFSDYEEAMRAAVEASGFVTNYTEFRRRGMLERMTVKPPAMRLFMLDPRKARLVYHVELDITIDELREPNAFTAHDEKHRPLVVEYLRKQAKIWEEK